MNPAKGFTLSERSESKGEQSISEILTFLTKNLTNYSDASRLDADRIVLHALQQREPSYLIAHSQDELSNIQIQKIQNMAEQRKTGMPLAYILGEADFYGRTFLVTPDVLIPRPDTETLIETALEYIKNNFSDKKEIIIADIGTGSGIIAITLALEIRKLKAIEPCLPAGRYKLVATDISPAALAVAKQNAAKHGVLEKIEFIQGDMLEPIKNRHVDLIVSNPPYVPTAELNRHPGLRACLSGRQAGIQTSASDVDSGSTPGMTTNVDTRGLDFEPRIALDGGPDGQKFVGQLKKESRPPARRVAIATIIETTGGEIIAC